MNEKAVLPTKRNFAINALSAQLRRTTRPFALKSHPAHLQHSKTLEKQGVTGPCYYFN